MKRIERFLPPLSRPAVQTTTRVVLVAASPQAAKPTVFTPNAQDQIVAVDGGAAYCIAWKWPIKTAIGDFDSASPEVLAELKKRGVNLITAPTRKDETDLELAVAHALALNAREIVIVASARGGRLDHALAATLLLTRPDFGDVDICLVEENQTLRVLRPNEKAIFRGTPGDTVSLLAIEGDVLGVNTRGLEWELADATLQMGYGRGVSNVLVHDEAAVTIETGNLLIIHIAQNLLEPSKNGEERNHETI